ncbi:MAG: phospholipase [Rhodocyclales bacterium GT-UBC]|nr:MAG: phospholipase [Rhodocyclales bacterium GT-UBC]
MPARSLLTLSRIALTGALLGQALPGQAAECSLIADDSKRLACYDAQFGGPAKAPPAAASPSAPEDNPSTRQEVASGNGLRSRMTDAWDLDPAHQPAPFEIRAYKPTYLLFGTYTDNINRQPTSGNSANTVTTPLDLRATEAQFQLSFKTKLWSNIFGNNGNLWAGYTQSSRWQVYSGDISRPFRETNYEPEVILVFNTPYSLGDWHWRMASIGLNHQSNGRSNPLSRSWNRAILHFGIEHRDLSIQIRPWWRIPENENSDDNPRIQNYVGRGEIIVAQRLGEHVLSLQARHSLRSGENSRGSAKLDWAIPLSGSHLKAHLSLFSGYGESLIDYNHRQTMIGAGISLIDW